nr:hypothetical protein [Hankyongella ginsenosidimutans]
MRRCAQGQVASGRVRGGRGFHNFRNRLGASSGSGCGAGASGLGDAIVGGAPRERIGCSTGATTTRTGACGCGATGAGGAPSRPHGRPAA